MRHGPNRHRWHKLQHQSERIVVGIYFAIWGLDVVRAIFGWVGWSSSFTSLTLSTLLVGMILTRWRHAGRLCEACIAEWPLDPETEVSKRMRYINAYHFILDSARRAVSIFVVFIAAWIASMLLFRAPVVDAVFGLPLALLMLTFYKHDFIRPWCPKCRRWDDGGGHEWVPDPDPAMSKGR
jgi:hypothetical protein